MRHVTPRVAEGDARAGVVLECYGPDAAGDVDLTAAVSRTPARVRTKGVQYHKEAYHRTPHHCAVRWAGHHGFTYHRQAHHKEVREIDIYGGWHEYGYLEFGVRARDRKGNVSTSPPNTARVLVNSSPMGLAAAKISVDFSGVVSMTVTQKVN